MKPGDVSHSVQVSRSDSVKLLLIIYHVLITHVVLYFKQLIDLKIIKYSRTLYRAVERVSFLVWFVKNYCFWELNTVIKYNKQWNNLLQVLLLPLECHHYQDFLYLSANKKKTVFVHIQPHKFKWGDIYTKKKRVSSPRLSLSFFTQLQNFVGVKSTRCCVQFKNCVRLPNSYFPHFLFTNLNKKKKTVKRKI